MVQHLSLQRQKLLVRKKLAEYSPWAFLLLVIMVVRFFSDLVIDICISWWEMVGVPEILTIFPKTRSRCMERLWEKFYFLFSCQKLCLLISVVSICLRVTHFRMEIKHILFSWLAPWFMCWCLRWCRDNQAWFMRKLQHSKG